MGKRVKYMNADFKIIGAVIIVTLIVLGIFLCAGGDSEENSGSENVISEITDTTLNQDDLMSESLAKELYLELENKNANPDSPSEGMPVSQSVSQDTVLESEKKTEEPPEQGAASSIQNNEKTGGNSGGSEALIESEKRELANFYKDIAEWDNPKISASKARNKAAELRASAQQVRESAATADPSVRNAMLNRAKIMEDYAERISVTRGNSAKLRAVEHKAQEDSSE